jgi:YVTN family beta-propeller protein
MSIRFASYVLPARVAVAFVAVAALTVSPSAVAATGAAPSPKPAAQTIGVGSHPIGVAVHSGTHEAFVTDVVDGTVSVIDPVTRMVKHVTQVGVGAQRIVVDSPRNLAYLVRGTGWLTVLSTETYAVTADIAVGDGPHGLAFDWAGYIYVTNMSSHTLSVIDLAAGMVVRTVPVGRSPLEVVVHPESRDIYIVHIDSRDLWVILGGPFSEYTHKIPLGGRPGGIAVDPGTSVIYVADNSHASLVALDPSTYSRLWSAPLDAHAFVTDLRLDLSVGRAGHAIIPLQTGRAVAIVDLHRQRMIRTVAVGDTPTHVAADAGTGYVTNQGDQSVSVFRT